MTSAASAEVEGPFSIFSTYARWPLNRGDSPLAYLVRTLKSLATLNKVNVASDLPGMGINGGTVPANILSASERPDIVTHFPTVRKVILMELTVPFEPNIKKARTRKLERYSQLQSDITSNNFNCHLPRGWKSGRPYKK